MHYVCLCESDFIFAICIFVTVYFDYTQVEAIHVHNRIMIIKNCVQIRKAKAVHTYYSTYIYFAKGTIQQEIEEYVYVVVVGK